MNNLPPQKPFGSFPPNYYQPQYPQNQQPIYPPTSEYTQRNFYPEEVEQIVKPHLTLKGHWRHFIHTTLGWDFNLADKILVSLISGMLLLLMVFGFISRVDDNRENLKLNDIINIVQSLNNFYYNSSSVKEKRKYPLAICSSSPNEIDFEYTLRYNLSGQNTQVDNNIYISVGNFPRDRQGSYKANMDSRKYLPGCKDSIPPKAYENINKVCDFDLSKSKNCYLYTSSASGDRYKLAYYSPLNKTFQVVEKVREQDIKLYYSNAL